MYNFLYDATQIILSSKIRHNRLNWNLNSKQIIAERDLTRELINSENSNLTLMSEKSHYFMFNLRRNITTKLLFNQYDCAFNVKTIYCLALTATIEFLRNPSIDEVLSSILPTKYSIVDDVILRLIHSLISTYAHN